MIVAEDTPGSYELVEYYMIKFYRPDPSVSEIHPRQGVKFTFADSKKEAIHRVYYQHYDDDPDLSRLRVCDDPVEIPSERLRDSGWINYFVFTKSQAIAKLRELQEEYNQKFHNLLSTLQDNAPIEESNSRIELD